MSNSTAQNLLLEVHSNLAAFIEPGNTPHLDSFHFIFSLYVTLQFICILPFHQKNITQKEFPQVQPTQAYHTARKIHCHISVVTVWKHAFTCFCMYKHSVLLQYVTTPLSNQFRKFRRYIVKGDSYRTKPIYLAADQKWWH
jgi:hypothetical protein